MVNENFPYLVLIKSDDPSYQEIGRRFQVSDVTLLGSHPQCNIQLPPRFVALYHLKIFKKDEVWLVEDISNFQNLYLNDVLTKRFNVSKDGETFKIGLLSFKFFLGIGVESEFEKAMYENTIVDPLTKVFNRKYLTTRLSDEISRISRTQLPLSILLLDIDYFKKINDQYGHIVGDMVLKEFCETIKKRLRKEEPFIRYGGEEFSVILPQTNYQAAVHLAEQLRILIQDHPLSFFPRPMFITTSIGIVTTHFSMEEQTLLNKVDEQLYLAKKHGRNCVMGIDLIGQ